MPAGPANPFLAALPGNSYPLQIDRSQISTTPPKLDSSLSCSSKLFVVAKKLNSFAINQIRTLSQKHPGGVRPSSAKPSRSLRLPAAGRSRRYYLQSLVARLFSRAYEVLPSSSRFACPAFSYSYELLFGASSFFSHRYKLPGCHPFRSLFCGLCALCVLCVKFFASRLLFLI
jgi:hypothetical protein